VNNEQKLASWFHGLFNFPLRSVAEGYGIFRKIFVADAVVDVSASPITLSNADVAEDRGTIVAIGGSGYNSVTGWIQTQKGARTRYSPAGDSISLDGIVIINDVTRGVIEKVVDEKGRVFFLAGGLSELATLACIYTLTSRWNDLRKKWDLRPFVQVVQVSSRGWNDVRLLDS
jgi:hypothetical protein